MVGLISLNFFHGHSFQVLLSFNVNTFISVNKFILAFIGFLVSGFIFFSAKASEIFHVMLYTFYLVQDRAVEEKQLK